MVLSYFEIPFQYGPRFLATGAGSIPTRSATDHSRELTPAAMVGVHRIAW